MRKALDGPAERGRDQLSRLGLLAEVGIARVQQFPRPVEHLPMRNELGVRAGIGLETIDVENEATEQPLRFPVQWVNRPNADFRGYAGTVASGAIKVGDPIVVAGSGQSSRVKELLAYEGPLAAAQSVLALTTAPVVNSPAAVLATSRSNNARRLSALPGVVAPITVILPRAQLCDNDAATTLARHGLGFPLLLRAPGFHTGLHFLRVERSDELRAAVEKIPGARVFAGAMNQSGVLEIRTDKIGHDTAFGRIIELVARAERSRNADEPELPRRALELESDLAAEVIRKSLRGDGDYLREEAPAARLGVGKFGDRRQSQ